MRKHAIVSALLLGSVIAFAATAIDTWQIKDKAITSAKIDTNIAIQGDLSVSGTIYGVPSSTSIAASLAPIISRADQAAVSSTTFATWESTASNQLSGLAASSTTFALWESTASAAQRSIQSWQSTASAQLSGLAASSTTFAAWQSTASNQLSGLAASSTTFATWESTASPVIATLGQSTGTFAQFESTVSPVVATLGQSTNTFNVWMGTASPSLAGKYSQGTALTASSETVTGAMDVGKLTTSSMTVSSQAGDASMTVAALTGSGHIAEINLQRGGLGTDAFTDFKLIDNAGTFYLQSNSGSGWLNECTVNPGTSFGFSNAVSVGGRLSVSDDLIESKNISAINITASSASFTTTSTFSVTLSSGMQFSTPGTGIVWADGSVSTTALVIVSSETEFCQGTQCTGSNANLGTCVTGSSVTISGRVLDVYASVAVQDSSIPSLVRVAAVCDGQFAKDYGAAIGNGLAQWQAGSLEYRSTNFLTQFFFSTTGPHTCCFTISTNAGTWQLPNTATSGGAIAKFRATRTQM